MKLCLFEKKIFLSLFVHTKKLPSKNAGRNLLKGCSGMALFHVRKIEFFTGIYEHV